MSAARVCVVDTPQPSHQHVPGAGLKWKQTVVVLDKRHGFVSDLVRDREMLWCPDPGRHLVDINVWILEQTLLQLQAENAMHRLVDATLTDLSVLNGFEHCVVREIKVGRHEQHVGAGLDRLDGHALVPEHLAHTLHGQRVGDYQPVEAQLLAQEPGENWLGQRRRPAGLKLSNGIAPETVGWSRPPCQGRCPPGPARFG
jgi:hypothetical protein